MTNEVDDYTPEVIPLDKLARVYRKMRAKIDALTKEYDAQVEELKAQQDEIKMAMKDQMRALGLTSVRTPEGTIIMSEKTRYTTNDWDSFKAFVLEHQVVDLLEKRIAQTNHQTNMVTFLDENPGIVPPGLNSMTEYDVSVRKPTK